MDMCEKERQRRVAAYQRRLEHAGRDGAFVAKLGRPATDNPHRPGTELHKRWQEGYTAALVPQSAAPGSAE